MVFHKPRFIQYAESTFTQGYAYGVQQPARNTDPFVKAALNEFDREYADSLRGWTKRPANSDELIEIFRSKIEGVNTVDAPPLDSKARASLQYAYNVVKDLFKVEKREPLTFEQVREHVAEDKSAGFSFPGMRKADVFDEAVVLAEELGLKARIGGPIRVPLTKLASRGHLSPEDKIKQRLIFNYPYEVLLWEGSYAIPMYEQLKAKLDGIMLFGKNVLPRIHKVVSTVYPENYYTVNTDIKGFDQSALVYMLELCFDILSQNIDFENWGGKPLGEAKQKRWRRVWDFVITYFIFTPVMLPNGEVALKRGKVPSGSWFTQLVDSVLNALYLVMLAHYHGHHIKSLYVLGDDGFLTTFGKPDLDSWAECLQRWFRVTLSVTKTKLFHGSDPNKEFLGYVFKHGHLYRTTDEWFRSLLYPERDVDCVEKTFSRFIAYMFLGGINDVKFVEFFDFFQRGYAIRDTLLYLDYDLKVKVERLGYPIPRKRLSEYTRRDFVFHLLSYNPVTR